MFGLPWGGQAVGLVDPRRSLPTETIPFYYQIYMKLSFQETQCFTNDNTEFSVNGKSDDHYEKLVKHTLGKNSRLLLLKLILKNHPACSADTQYHCNEVHGSWISTCWEHVTEKQLYRKGPEFLVDTTLNISQQHALHKRELMVSLAALEMLSAGWGRGSFPLLSTGVAKLGVLCAVLDSPV